MCWRTDQQRRPAMLSSAFRCVVHSCKTSSNIIVFLIVLDIGGRLVDGLYCTESAEGAPVDVVRGRSCVHDELSALYYRRFARVQNNFNESNCVIFFMWSVVYNFTVSGSGLFFTFLLILLLLFVFMRYFLLAYFQICISLTYLGASENLGFRVEISYRRDDAYQVLPKLM